jgi:D-alanyl-D-alanine carboxypeptidase
MRRKTTSSPTVTIARMMLDAVRVSHDPAGRSPCAGARCGLPRLVRDRLGILVAGVLLALVLVPAGPAAAALGRSSPRAAALTAAIRGVMRQASIPGAIVGVWQRGAAPYVRAFGVRDTATGQPMSTDLRMRIGSVTKTFLGTALLELVDQGKVCLDCPVSRYLAGIPHGNAITIRELAEMRSGLFDYFANDAWVRAWLTHPRRGWTPRQLLAYSFSKPLRFAPGTSYDYSNANFLLLGLVVQKVSHQPLATYIKQHILEPEHLTHTSLPPGAAFPSPHAQGYTNFTVECVVLHACDTTVNATSWNLSVGWAAGAMVSTVGDLHRWARDVATGRLLTSTTQRQRLRFIAVPGVRHYGYGLALNNNNGWIGHNGDFPGYQSLSIYLPSQQATVVVLINTNTTSPHGPPLLLLGQAITRIITPKHVYEFVATNL